jgi:hypothetical protein
MTRLARCDHAQKCSKVAELLHRVGNDYTRVITFASLWAANASSNEARSALASHRNTLWWSAFPVVRWD